MISHERLVLLAITDPVFVVVSPFAATTNYFTTLRQMKRINADPQEEEEIYADTRRLRLPRLPPLLTTIPTYFTQAAEKT